MKPPNNKEAEKGVFISAGSREDEYKQSARDHRVTAVSQVQALRGLKGKIQLKTRVTYTAPVICRHNDDLPVCDLGILLEYKHVLQNAAVCGDVTQRQILQLHH